MLLLGAVVAAVVAGVLLAFSYVERCKAENRAQQMRVAAGVAGSEASRPPRFLSAGVPAKVLDALVREQVRIEARAGGLKVGGKLPKRIAERARALLVHAGLGNVSVEACGAVSARLGAAGAGCGVAIGLAVGPAMGAALGLAGAWFGATLPWNALRSESRARANAASQELPQLLDVIALGLRSGMTFERSFRLYPAYFDTAFAADCAAAISQWEVGLATRDEALRALAAGYDCVGLSRVMGMTVQALRTGTSMVKQFDAAAAEARKQHRAEKERVVAKAPVKMLVPIGALMLPAMLLLVLGPVLLELISGL